MNNPSFIRSLIHGDEQAFKQLVEQYGSMVYNTVLSIVLQQQEAEDICQEVFVQVYHSVSGFNGDAKLSTWLYRIAVNKALERERRNKTAKRINSFKKVIGLGVSEEETVAELNHPGIRLEQKEQAAVLFSALKQLPEKQRIAFTLVKTEGLSYTEVSEVMNTSVASVEGLLHRAKENLRSILTSYYTS